MRFVRNTIMKGIDRIGVASLWSVLTGLFPTTKTADTPRSTKGIICIISNEITGSYVLTDRTKNAIGFALPVTEGNAVVEPNPANSTRKAGAV